jgi:GT2 family glycosyltransferase
MPLPSDFSIYAVIVLYNVAPSSSAAVAAFEAAADADAALKENFHLLLYDNSPSASDATPRFEYHHDPRNEGLPAAYNFALDRAGAEDCRWLLLLDQDTQVTRDYLLEVIALTKQFNDDPTIGAIVPKLVSAKGIKSPTLDFLEWLRRQMQFPRKRALFATREMYGLQDEQFSAFNSASVLRVSALQQIGGFPHEFWLDFLDIAVFNRLHGAGWRMFVMHATLLHELSMDSRVFYEKQGGLARHRNLLAAMVLFVNTHGTKRDRGLMRMWLLRNAMNLFISARDKRFGVASLLQAIKLQPSEPRP